MASYTFVVRPFVFVRRPTCKLRRRLTTTVWSGKKLETTAPICRCKGYKPFIRRDLLRKKSTRKLNRRPRRFVSVDQPRSPEGCALTGRATLKNHRARRTRISIPSELAQTSAVPWSCDTVSLAVQHSQRRTSFAHIIAALSYLSRMRTVA